MRRDLRLLKWIIYETAKALALFETKKLVHSDLKTDNILVQMGPGMKFKELKLIDFGSTFKFGNLNQFSMATPEYMSPEILAYIL